LLEPRGAIRQRASRLDLGLHVGQLVPDRLEAPDRPPEGVALLRIRRGDVERRLGDAYRLRGDPDAPSVQRRQGDAHPATWPAEPDPEPASVSAKATNSGPCASGGT